MQVESVCVSLCRCGGEAFLRSLQAVLRADSSSGPLKVAEKFWAADFAGKVFSCWPVAAHCVPRILTPAWAADCPSNGSGFLQFPLVKQISPRIPWFLVCH